MAYEQRPGQFALFKNTRKEKDSHPDYKGDGLAPDGTPVWVSAWLKDGAKGKFMSCSMQAKEQKDAAPKQEKRPTEDLDDDLPF